MSAFEDLGVMPEIIRAVEDLEWILPTPIQQEAIPLILGGGDVLAAAETGSGKTGAFALPILQIVYETLNNKANVEIPSTSDNNNNNASNDGGELTIKWNIDDRDKDLAVDGLVVQSRAADWAGGRTNYGISKGKYYYEATVRDEGLCRVGWAFKKSSRSIGTDKFSWGYGGTGKKSHEGKFENYGLPYGLNDTIGCYIDLDSGIVGYTKNGQDFGQAYSIDASKLGGNIYYPAVLLKNAEMGFNFGETKLKHQLNGYLPLSQAPLQRDENVTPAAATTTPVNQNQNKKKAAMLNNTIEQRKPLSLIIEPVKELADQTYSAILNFSKYLDSPKIEPVLCLGGDISAKKSSKDLRSGGDIVVGTPGILDKLIKENIIDVSNIRFFVLDEADQLIQDNLPILNYIYNKLPKAQLQVLFFSATLHSDKVVQFSESITKNPTWVDLKGKDFIPELIHHSYCVADPEKYESMWKRDADGSPMIESSDPIANVTTDGIHSQDVKSLDRLKTPEQKSLAVKLLKPHLLVRCIRAFKMDQALIFARTRIDCDNLSKYLTDLGGGKTLLENEFSNVVLHGDKGSQQRKDNLEKFKSGEVRFLICTDVASRGIDVSGLPFVINFTLPDTFEDYIHRVGRVGRAERLGLAVSIVSKYEEKVWYHNCRDKGRGCHNTKLTDQGGCAIWYDEPSLFNAIIEKLSPTLLNDQFKLDDMSIVESAGKLNKPGGAKENAYVTHTEQLKSRVLELASLEETIQRDYLNLPLSISKKIK